MSNTPSIAIVVSTFNSEITEKLLEGAISQLNQSGIPTQKLTIIKVPGAVEIPLTTKLLCLSKKYAAVICLGAVIRGDTDHYDYVCQQVSNGCQQVMLEFNTPIIFGVLTTNNEEQALARVVPGNHKGEEAAQAALSMIEIVRSLNETPVLI